MTEPISLEQWATELADALGLPPAAAESRQVILDVTRDAAHAISRPAAPIAAFLVGIAAGRDGATPEAIAAACKTATDLALAHGGEQ